MVNFLSWLPVNCGRRFPMLPTPWNGTGLAPAATQAAPANRLASLFDRFFNDDFFTSATPSAWVALPLGMWEDDDNVYVELDAPGLTEKDFELSIHDGALIIRGERKCEQPQEWIYESRRYGRFEQRVKLPGTVDFDRTCARLAQGVLRVTLPKRPESKPRQIAVQAG
jgi:HSP20 family protein